MSAILILGGTAEARELAAQLDAAGITVVSSLAGRVSQPRLPVGAVRIGGFGGPQGLGAWIAEQEVTAVVDATHPFAERISDSAVQACGERGTPLLRLQRPGWTAQSGDDWHWATDLPQAAAMIEDLGGRVFLTTGRQGLDAFATLTDAWFLVRCVDPPQPPLPARYTLLLDRGPYTLAGELALIDQHRLDLLITKDSGGPLTAAKLQAARERGLAVIIVRRPSRPATSSVASVAQAFAWVRAQAG